MNYVNYHRHSHISNMYLPDSVVTNEDYAKRCVELGHLILSSCEHGTQGDYRETYELAKKYGLKWRYVCEAYFVKDRFEKDNTNAHLVLAAKTEKGVGDLNELLSEANITGFYYRPRVDLALLMSLDPRDVFITTACVGGVFKYGEEDAENIIRTLYSRFKGSMMLEIQAHNTPKQKAVNDIILRLYRKYNIPLIAGADSHYIYPEQDDLRQQRLEANGIIYEDEAGWYMDYPDGNTLFKRFREQGSFSEAQIEEAMENTNVFLDFQDVEFDKSKKLPTLYPHLTQSERNDVYRQLVMTQFERETKGMPPELVAVYREGVEYEINTITSTNTSDYFLINYEIIKRGKEKGGMLTTTGRGSAPSYYTNTLLGFSSIDRFSIPVTMYPDRFISADRILSGSLPDIDYNCGDVEPFIEAQVEVLGLWHSAPMVAFGTLKKASAWKMYCRAVNVDFELANSVSDQLKEFDKAVQYAEDDDKDDIDVADYVSEEYLDIYAQSENYQGIVDSISPHPCAHVLCINDVRREFGVIRINSGQGKNKKELFCAFIKGTTAEAFGYLKNDMLKVDVVKINALAWKRIGKPMPTAKELMELAKNDSLTWGIYAKGLTMGLNQVEKEKATSKVMQYKPKNITELSAFVAGIRPSFKSMISYLLGRQKFSYNIPALDKIIQTEEMRSSFLLYQEQLMTILQYGGFTGPESYAAIKAISKKHPEKVKVLKERFDKGFSERLISDDPKINRQLAAQTTNDVWQIMSDACGYGFNSCLTGDTIIKRPKNGGYVPTIDEMFRIRNDREYARKTNHLDLHKKYKRYGYGFAPSLNKDERLVRNKIVDIREAGIRQTYRLTLENGMYVDCTSNHKFPTPEGEKKLDTLAVGDLLYVEDGYEKSKNKRKFTDGSFESNLPQKGQMGLLTKKVKIASIEPLSVVMTYDVEMADPYHTFVVNDGIVTSNSHAVSVALDSLYGAYTKAHYPFQYYITMLDVYGEKNKKEKLAMIKEEMRSGYGILIVPCKFRQDNRDYFIDYDNKSVSDTLSSAKFMNTLASESLYSIGKSFDGDFIDLLVELTDNTSINSRQIIILIKMGYFDEFGTPLKLLAIYDEFKKGKHKYVKTLIPKTKESRLQILRQRAEYHEDGDLSAVEKVQFETEIYGIPISIFPNERMTYCVIEVDAKYSPKLRMYSLATGKMGVMKVKKVDFNRCPLVAGDCIIVEDWVRKTAYQYVGGKSVPREGVKDIWILDYTKIASQTGLKEE